MPELTTGERLFLQALSCAIRGDRLTLGAELQVSEWLELRTLAYQHRVLPLLAEAMVPGTAFSRLPGELPRLQELARSRTVSQAARTAEFLDLLDQLSQRGLNPVVMKGIVCRSLYPHPEQRLSSDEDLLISPEERSVYHEAFLACGLRLAEASSVLLSADEITYEDPERELCIELHLKPFPGEDSMWGDFNHAFQNVFERSTCVNIYGRMVRTMEPTDHLLYLLCHAYKHLIHSGVGLRQICDLCLFAQRFGGVIDWHRLQSECSALGIEYLASAMFLIGQRWLEIPAPTSFTDPAPDEIPLLKDCLSGGLYGAEDKDRVHSRAYTLDEIRASREGRRPHGTARSLFPGRSSLAGRYPYLRKRPWLLPAAWVQRLWGYVIRERANPGKSIQIGRERIALLKQYQILP